MGEHKPGELLGLSAEALAYGDLDLEDSWSHWPFETGATESGVRAYCLAFSV